MEPYRPPLSVTEKPVTPRRALGWSLKLSMALALLPFVAWGSCASGAVSEDTGIYLWFVASALALVGAVTAILWRERNRFWAVAAALTGLLSPVVTFLLALLVAPGFEYTRGRALRRRGRARLPELEPRTDWAPDTARLGRSDAQAAAGWRLNGATEHASVAAFAHLAAELMALGAPPELVARAHEDALDEIRHAELCFGLAAAIDEKPMGPAPFPSAVRTRDERLTHASLAADCIIESCLFESASAMAAAELAARPDVPPPIRRILETIADDEARHARHGAEIVSWCIQQGGLPVRRAVDAALAAVEPPKGSAAAPDGYESWGLAGPTLWSRCVEKALRTTTGKFRSLQQAAPSY